MTLHFYNAETYPLDRPGTGLVFRYLPKGYMDAGHIRLAINQDLSSLDESQKTQAIQRAFGAAVYLIHTTWSNEQRLPSEHVTHKEDIEFTLTHQKPVNWDGYDLDLHDQ